MPESHTESCHLEEHQSAIKHSENYLSTSRQPMCIDGNCSKNMPQLGKVSFAFSGLHLETMSTVNISFACYTDH